MNRAAEINSLLCVIRIFGGLVNDVRRKTPFLWSDIRDSLSLQCLASILFLYCACMSPVITFGGLLGEATKGNIVRTTIQERSHLRKSPCSSHNISAFVRWYFVPEIIVINNMVDVLRPFDVSDAELSRHKWPIICTVLEHITHWNAVYAAFSCSSGTKFYLQAWSSLMSQ